MTGIIQGNDVLFQIHNGATYVDFVCAKDVSINHVTSLVNVSTLGDENWDNFEPQSKGYTVSLTGVIKFDTTKITAWDLLARQFADLAVQFRMIFIDQEDANTKILFGSFWVENSNLTANVGQVAGCDFSFKGNGKPTLAEEMAGVDPPTEFEAKWGWTSVNPYFSLHGSGAELVELQESAVFPVGSHIVVNYPAASAGKYLIMREPVSEPVKVAWLHTAVFNQGTFPDSDWYTPFVGTFNPQFRYYATRHKVTFDPAYDLTFFR